MPKKPYNFKMVKTTGECINFTPRGFCGFNSGSLDVNIPGLFMSPYTDFIPLLYLLNAYPCHPIPSDIASSMRELLHVRKNNPNKLAAFNKKWNGRMFTAFTGGYGPEDYEGDINFIQEGVKEDVHRWVYRDSPINIDKLPIRRECYRDQILLGFAEDAIMAFDQNSYSGLMAPYSLFYRYVGKYKPGMVAVVLPENYVYIKHHILVHNTVPLDKVLILIDKDLDNVDSISYPPAFKRLYRELYPKIKRSACQVWRVPGEFIRENCFVESFRMKSTTIADRRKEKGELLNEMYALEATYNGDSLVEDLQRGGFNSTSILENLPETSPIEGVTWLDTSSETYQWTVPYTPHTGTVSYTIAIGRGGAQSMSEALGSPPPQDIPNPFSVESIREALNSLYGNEAVGTAIHSATEEF